MAIFGIGANYEGEDVSDWFVATKSACVGWDASDAPALHAIMKSFKVGDIVYIKSAPIGHGLRVKGVGIISDTSMSTMKYDGNNIGTGVQVQWIWTGHENLGAIDDKYNVRNNTLYEEHNPFVQSRVLALLLAKIR